MPSEDAPEVLAPQELPRPDGWEEDWQEEGQEVEVAWGLILGLEF
jgi:hypothetical protein